MRAWIPLKTRRAEPGRGIKMNWRRHPDSNRSIKALQASALPLGYAASTTAPLYGYGRYDVKSFPLHGRDFWDKPYMQSALSEQGIFEQVDR